LTRSTDESALFTPYTKKPIQSRFAPFFKPDFDPILLMNYCYPARLMAMEAKFLRDIGAYTDSRARHPEYDTLTRALSIGEQPVHVREAIYAKRISGGSTGLAEAYSQAASTDPQHFALRRLLEARRLSHALVLEPNSIATSRGALWVRATKPLPAVRSFGIEEAWGERGLGVAGLSCGRRGAECHLDRYRWWRRSGPIYS
jgi:hypothetical protein